MTTKDKILITRLKKFLTEKYSYIISDIIIYGSRIAKGRTDSDFDLIIITSKEIDWKKKREIKNEIYEIGIDNDVVFDPKVFSSYELNHKYKYHPFFMSVEKTGVYL